MSGNRIRPCTAADFDTVWSIINDGAEAYKGHVPPDCLHPTYMPHAELKAEIDAGVAFWGFEYDGTLVAVMGLQMVRDVALIRHAYVRSARQGEGIGSCLLGYLQAQVARPVLVGTWEAATWAIRFYIRHGFQKVPTLEKHHLLKTYWSVPERQIERSVVLADEKWFALGPRPTGEA